MRGARTAEDVLRAFVWERTRRGVLRSSAGIDLEMPRLPPVQSSGKYEDLLLLTAGVDEDTLRALTVLWHGRGRQRYGEHRDRDTGVLLEGYYTDKLTRAEVAKAFGWTVPELTRREHVACEVIDRNLLRRSE